MEISLKKKQFEIYKEEVKYWLNKLGLVGWEVHFEFGDDYSTIWNEGDRAAASHNFQAKLVTFWLNKVQNADEINDFTLRKSAYHEVMEIFLTTISALAYDRVVTQDHIEAAKHSVIRALENTQFEDDYNGRKLPKRVQKKS